MKIIKSIINVLTTLIIVVGIIILGLYIVGITPYVVMSGSMEPAIQTGSLSFINKHAKYEKVKEKDIIAFKMKDGTLVTHRVHEITDEGIVTKGDANEVVDEKITTKENFIGKNILSIPKVGYVIKATQTTKGKIIFGTIIIVLFLSGILLGEPEKKK